MANRVRPFSHAGEHRTLEILSALLREDSWLSEGRSGRPQAAMTKERDGEVRREEGARPLGHPGSGDGLRAPTGELLPPPDRPPLRHCAGERGRSRLARSQASSPWSPRSAGSWWPRPGPQGDPFYKLFHDDCRGPPTYRDSNCTAGGHPSFLSHPTSLSKARQLHLQNTPAAGLASLSPPLPRQPRPPSPVSEGCLSLLRPLLSLDAPPLTWRPEGPL